MGPNAPDDCCKPDHQCDVGGGDCDTDDDCKGDLYCGKDNCATVSVAHTFPAQNFDCCERGKNAAAH